MAATFQAGAVLYAKDLALVKEFYQAVLSLNLEHAENDHVVLASKAFQLVILRVPDHIASSIEIESPPRRRTEAAIKLVFEVPSISVVRAIAHLHGGELSSPEREWNFQGYRVCDGQDPEGNVLQFRQRYHFRAMGYVDTFSVLVLARAIQKRRNQCADLLEKWHVY
jgi:predicted enzyme related to lactoylglutathione lyase